METLDSEKDGKAHTSARELTARSSVASAHRSERETRDKPERTMRETLNGSAWERVFFRLRNEEESRVPNKRYITSTRFRCSVNSFGMLQSLSRKEISGETLCLNRVKDAHVAFRAVEKPRHVRGTDYRPRFLQCSWSCCSCGRRAVFLFQYPWMPSNLNFRALPKSLDVNIRVVRLVRSCHIAASFNQWSEFS